MASDEQQVRAIIERWSKAVQDRDMAGTLATHSPDILMFDVPEPIQARGIAEYRETWELFFRYSPGGEDSFRLGELEIVAGDTVAFAHCLLDVVDVRCRLTVALRKNDGEWVIVHEHHSSPWPDPRGVE
jgi:ketosteroid isomerase-like protein